MPFLLMNLVNILAVELAPLDERRLGRCDCPLLSTRSPCARSFTRAEQLLQRLGSDSHAGGRPFLSFKIIHFESEKYLFSQRFIPFRLFHWCPNMCWKPNLYPSYSLSFTLKQKTLLLPWYYFLFICLFYCSVFLIFFKNIIHRLHTFLFLIFFSFVLIFFF